MLNIIYQDGIVEFLTGEYVFKVTTNDLIEIMVTTKQDYETKLAQTHNSLLNKFPLIYRLADLYAKDRSKPHTFWIRKLGSRTYQKWFEVLED